MNDVFVIAEIGINHNGDLNLAKKMIKTAKECGADAVKFQKRTIELVYTKEELDAPRESLWGNTNRHQKMGLEFGKEQYDEIDRYCKELQIEWFASAWDLESQRFLQQYNLKYNKVASALLTHKDLLELIASEGRHTFISTGMSAVEQIDEAVSIFDLKKCPYTIMACTSTYPCSIDETNIRVVQTLGYRYKNSIGIGFSAHTKGPLSSVLAVAMGATVIETHFTLDRALIGSDQSSSLEPAGFERVCRDAREVNRMLGDGIKKVYNSEIPIMKKLRKY